MRYLPHTPSEIKEMLEAIGVSSIEDLFSSIPAKSRRHQPLNLPEPLSEIELRNVLGTLAHQNLNPTNGGRMFLGSGTYAHWTPSLVPQLVTRGEFLTAYTPYQPEVSQGTLQAIFEFQTMVSEILDMDVANASMYDASTGMAEAVIMALTHTKRKKALVAKNIHPQYREVLKTYLLSRNLSFEEIPFLASGKTDPGWLDQHLSEEIGAVVLGYPNFFGVVEDLTPFSQRARDYGAFCVSVTQEPVSLGLYQAPGIMGIDIAIAEGQSFGVPMSLGGPGLGLFSTREKFIRSMPGRLVGETRDLDGKKGYVLTLSTREQHIRREKATSNICTNVSLCALMATMTLSSWGKKGFVEIARRNFDQAEYLKKEISKIRGFSIPFQSPTFNEFVVAYDGCLETLLKNLRQKKIEPGFPLRNDYPQLATHFVLCTTELHSQADLDYLIQTLRDLA